MNFKQMLLFFVMVIFGFLVAIPLFGDANLLVRGVSYGLVALACAWIATRFWKGQS